MIYFTSDLHLGHDRGFIYEPRGFQFVDEMNEAISSNWNKEVSDDDDVYILGDLMLGDNEKGMAALLQLKGKKHIIIGNHDTSERVRIYQNTTGISVLGYSDMLKYKDYTFYMSHYPTITGDLTATDLKKTVINLHGHLHTKEKFYQDIPYIYNVSVDCQNNRPVAITDIISDIKSKAEECFSFL